MKHKKIHIIGGPGSGKTFISKKISEENDLPFFELDNIFWDKSRRDYVRTSDDFRASVIESILRNNSWIIEGVYYKWLSRTFEKADVIIVLKTPLFLRQWRIFKRFIIRKLDSKHKKRESLSSFIEMALWNHNYDSDNLVRFTNFTSMYADKIVYCNNSSEVESALLLS